jgi:hypothetical protein
MTDLSQPAAAAQSQAVPDGIPLPLWLLAELTYRCPLHCAFCYNPIDYTDHSRELSTEQWLNVLREARALGAAQLGFSGGEPLVRDDLEVLVAEARKLGFYTNLITSGVGLTDKRLDGLQARRPRPYPVVVPGFDPATERLPQQHPHLRTETTRGRIDQGSTAFRWCSIACCIATTCRTSTRSSTWRWRWAPSTWSSPTRSTTAGRIKTKRS